MNPSTQALYLLSTSIDHPAIHRLVKVERAGDGHVRLDVLETCLLERAVRRHIERIGLAEELLQLEKLEIQFDGLSHALCADTLLALWGIDDVKVHVRLLADADLVSSREPQEPVIAKPTH